jgi:hypothetical protein
LVNQGVSIEISHWLLLWQSWNLLLRNDQRLGKFFLLNSELVLKAFNLIHGFSLEQFPFLRQFNESGPALECCSAIYLFNFDIFFLELLKCCCNFLNNEFFLIQLSSLVHFGSRFHDVKCSFKSLAAHFGVTPLHPVFEGRLHFDVDDLVFTHHVHSFFVKQILPSFIFQLFIFFMLLINLFGQFFAILKIQ